MSERRGSLGVVRATSLYVAAVLGTGVLALAQLTRRKAQSLRAFLTPAARAVPDDPADSHGDETADELLVLALHADDVVRAEKLVAVVLLDLKDEVQHRRDPHRLERREAEGAGEHDHDRTVPVRMRHVVELADVRVVEAEGVARHVEGEHGEVEAVEPPRVLVPLPALVPQLPEQREEHRESEADDHVARRE